MLMSASKAKLCVPTKYDIMQTSVTLKVKNDMIDCLSENTLGWESSYSETNSCTFVNTLVEVIWYADGNFQTLHDHGCGIPEMFSHFQAYNKPELRKKEKTR